MTKSVATLKEIAAAAGCSPRAAAAVLNPSHGNVRVGEATKQRVQEIAHKLGYRRNEFARAMVTGQSHVIGLLTSVTISETVVRMMEGALDEAAAQGYVTKILRLPYFPTPEQVHDLVQHCSTWRLDGVLAIGPRDDVLDCLALEIEHNPRPIAYIESSPRGRDGILVRSDDAGGMQAALSHLAELGHQRIAFLGGRQDSSVSLTRATLFANLLLELGLPIDEQLIVHSDWSNIQIIEPAAMQLLDAVPRPTAILCAGDAGAMVTLRLARQRGLALPTQLSVVGYGNAALSVYADPSLTTVAQPFGDMGRLAAQRLLERIKLEKTDSPNAASSYDTLPQQLIVRDSTAPPPGNF